MDHLLVYDNLGLFVFLFSKNDKSRTDLFPFGFIL